MIGGARADSARPHGRQSPASQPAVDRDRAERFVDPQRYQENCVGFTHGFADPGVRR
jgi:hypothetical protein